MRQLWFDCFGRVADLYLMYGPWRIMFRIRRKQDEEYVGYKNKILSQPAWGESGGSCRSWRKYFMSVSTVCFMREKIQKSPDSICQRMSVRHVSAGRHMPLCCMWRFCRLITNRSSPRPGVDKVFLHEYNETMRRDKNVTL